MPEHQKPIHVEPLLGGSSLPRRVSRRKLIEFPIGFEELLLWAMPKERPENRMRVYWRLVRESLHGRYSRPPTDDEIVAELQSMRQKTFGEYRCECIRADMSRCAEIIKRENLEKRAKAGAEVRWKKKKLSKVK